MEKIATPIADLYILEPKVFRDDRGYFVELFNQQKFQDLGFTCHENEIQIRSMPGKETEFHFQVDLLNR